MPKYQMVITELVNDGTPGGNYISASRVLIPNSRPANEVLRAVFIHAGLTRDSVAVETFLVNVGTTLAADTTAA